MHVTLSWTSIHACTMHVLWGTPCHALGRLPCAAKACQAHPPCLPALRHKTCTTAWHVPTSQTLSLHFGMQIFGGAGILGEGNLGELSSALLVDGVQMIACWITVVIVDYVGRRVLLLCGTMQGAVSLIAAGVVLKYASQGHAELATAPAGVVTFLVSACLCCMLEAAIEVCAFVDVIL